MKNSKDSSSLTDKQLEVYSEYYDLIDENNYSWSTLENIYNRFQNASSSMFVDDQLDKEKADEAKDLEKLFCNKAKKYFNDESLDFDSAISMFQKEMESKNNIDGKKKL